MRDLLNQERALSLGLVKTAISMISAAFLVVALFIVLFALGNMFSAGRFFTGLLQLVGGLALLFWFYLMLRFMAEILTAAHRMNDRLAILTDEMRAARSPASPPPQPKPAPEAKSARTARKTPAKKTVASADEADTTAEPNG